MMQEEFSKNGIEFAHRNVTVYLPPQESGSNPELGKETEEASTPDRKTLEAAAAAAALAAEQVDAGEQAPEKKK